MKDNPAQAKICNSDQGQQHSPRVVDVLEIPVSLPASADCGAASEEITGNALIVDSGFNIRLINFFGD